MIGVKIKRHLPFDFVLETYKLIIELDGKQHFEQVSNWCDPEETLKTDNYKNQMAIENNYSIIRISQEIVWNDDEDWENQLINTINIIDKNKCEIYKIGKVYFRS